MYLCIDVLLATASFFGTCLLPAAGIPAQALPTCSAACTGGTRLVVQVPAVLALTSATSRPFGMLNFRVTPFLCVCLYFSCYSGEVQERRVVSQPCPTSPCFRLRLMLLLRGNLVIQKRKPRLCSLETALESVSQLFCFSYIHASVQLGCPQLVAN